MAAFGTPERNEPTGHAGGLRLQPLRYVSRQRRVAWIACGASLPNRRTNVVATLTRQAAKLGASLRTG